MGAGASKPSTSRHPCLRQPTKRTLLEGGPDWEHLPQPGVQARQAFLLDASMKPSAERRAMWVGGGGVGVGWGGGGMRHMGGAQRKAARTTIIRHRQTQKNRQTQGRDVAPACTATARSGPTGRRSGACRTCARLALQGPLLLLFAGQAVGDGGAVDAGVALLEVAGLAAALALAVGALAGGAAHGALRGGEGPEGGGRRGGWYYGAWERSPQGPSAQHSTRLARAGRLCPRAASTANAPPCSCPWNQRKASFASADRPRDPRTCRTSACLEQVGTRGAA